MKKNNFAEIFYKNAGYIVVVLISLVYVASSLIMISKTGKSVGEIIGTGALSMIVGLLINGVFRSIGVRKGDEDERTIATNTLHTQTVESITPYIDKLDNFCEIETRSTIKSLRTKILARQGLKYEDCFDNEGVARAFPCQLPKEPKKEEIKAYKCKLKAFRKACNLKIKPLLASNLTSDGAKAENPFDFGRSKKQFTNQQNASDILSRVLMAVIFGYFGVTLASEINVASLIWNSLQIIMYVCGGVVQMYTSYSWVVDDYRQSIIKKIDVLEKFKIYAEKEQEKNVSRKSVDNTGL